jgi:hypothetical protein
VNAGIFVNIAVPKQIPEQMHSTLVYLGLLLISIARRIDDKIKGSMIESNTILRVSQVNGMTPNNKAAKKPTYGLKRLSDMRKIRKVSSTASKLIMILGVANRVSIELISEFGCNADG